MHEGQKLGGWKGIAEYLGVSLRTAQYWHDRLGLPVLKGPGNRGRVSASATDLDDWKAQHWNPAQDALAQETGVEPLIAAAADASANVDQVGSVSAIAPNATTASVRGPWIFVVIVTLLAILAVVWVARNAALPIGTPAVIETVANTLIVRDGEGRESWRHVFPRKLSSGYSLPSWVNQMWFAGDIDGDGETEVVFGYLPEVVPEDADSQVQEVLCFSQDGKRVKWRFRPGRPKLIDNTGDQYFPPYWLNAIKLVPGRSPKGARIVVSSRHHEDAPNQIAVLNGQGRLVGEYWHPGHLFQVGFADLDGDEKPKLLLGGVNNGAHAATLLVFDPDNVSGTATGLSDARFGLRDLPAGTERAVVIFPRACLAREGPTPEPYNRLIELKITKNRLHLVVTAGILTSDPRYLIYQMDYGLNIHAVIASTAFQQTHLNWERSGFLNHALFPNEIDQLASRVIVERRYADAPASSADVVPLPRPQRKIE